MLFDSLLFLYVFLPIVLLGFYLLLRLRMPNQAMFFLTAASLFFYGYWKEKHVVIILGSILFNYAMAYAIDKTRHAKAYLIAAISGNLALLCYFKYAHFFMTNLSHFLPLSLDIKQVALPLGISFYTFTQIAYLTDVYQKKTKTYGLMEYSLFVLLFPHLVAGPIVHYSEIMPQFKTLRTKFVQYKNIFRGLFFLVVGLFQKTVFANYLNPIADSGFLNPSSLNGGDAWLSVFAYSFQIYFDFAGYSNMAIGLALLFNIQFPINFNSPYQALSIIDFWKRWHMTLSAFLRDYLYIPLGGGRKGEVRRLVNILLTMLIGGLWHGASWTFVAWGGYHGILIVLNHLIRKFKINIPGGIKKITVFLLVTYGWVFFKAADFEKAQSMTHALLHPGRLSGSIFHSQQFLLTALIGAIALLFPNILWWEKKLKPNPAWVLLLCVMFATCFVLISRTGVPTVFLYWQF